MRFSFLLVAAAFAAESFALPSSNHVVHEKRNKLPHGWVRRATIDSKTTVPVKVALTQRNLDRANEFLMDVSDPKSANYGKHWSAKQVAETFAPSHASIHSVKTWLTEAGISGDRISMAQGLGWLHFDATIEEAEQLLKTKYYVYGHIPSGRPHVACEEYSIPEHLSDHIDFITPTVHFDSKVNNRPNDPTRRKRDLDAEKSRYEFAHRIGWQKSSLPKLGAILENLPMAKNETTLRVAANTTDLSDCDTTIVPDCLRALYDFSENTESNPDNSYGVVEYTPQSYIPSDLQEFFEAYDPAAVGSVPIFESIDGGFLQEVIDDINYYVESPLDLDYAMSLVYPQNVTLYQVGDFYEGASFNDFLDALDGSYCLGDSPIYDAVYPDPYCNATDYGCYKGPKDCGGFAATKVISTSYGYNEADLTPAYEIRQCNEYMKFGLQGTSVLFSSGDYGVAGNGGQCIDPATGNYNNGTSGRFNPGFPAACPYITSVGATQIIPGTDITDLPTTTQPEMACETVIYSGGGFSDVFAMPDYQKEAVSAWWADNMGIYSATQFNNSEQTRGYPDVSANGANYAVIIDGTAYHVYGTSASSPTLGSILTLINQELLDAGKSTIGFANPVLYANPEVLKDVTEGNNPGCGTEGFEAVAGWDPVTGLGTPEYPAMLALFLGTYDSYKKDA